jgi:hypothetical protein
MNYQIQGLSIHAEVHETAEPALGSRPKISLPQRCCEVVCVLKLTLTLTTLAP